MVFKGVLHKSVQQMAGMLWCWELAAVLNCSVPVYSHRASDQTHVPPDQLVYDDRLLSYSARLTLAVNVVLRETGLLSEDST